MLEARVKQVQLPVTVELGSTDISIEDFFVYTNCDNTA